MAVEKTIIIKANTKDVENGLNNVNKELKQTNESTKEMNSTLDKATGGAVTRFNGLKSTLGGVIKSFKSLKIAIIGTGIGALLIAVTSLGQAFTRSEEGQNKFAKILGIIGSVTGNLLDLLADLGENIISVFENPKQAITDFAKLIKQNITNRFEGLIELVPKLGKAITLLFKGEFKEAGKVATDAVGKVALGIDSVTDSTTKAIDKIKQFGKEVVADADAAAKIADQRAKADKLARDLIVERAEAERKIAELREKAADKENFTAKERIEFLKQAGAVSDEIANKETELAKIRLEAKQVENALTKSTKEDLDEEARLKADLLNKETQRLRLQKALTAEVTTATRENNAELKAIADQKAAEDKERADKVAAENKARKDKEEKEDKERNERKIQEQKAIQEAELEIKNASLDAATAGFSILASFDKKNKKLQAATLIASNAVGIAKNIINTNAANARITAEAGLAAPPLILANNIRMITGIAASVSATAKGLSALKSGGSATGGGGTGGAAQTQAPSFNIVGASPTNQLAEAIGGQEQQPVQAYVVSNDVTTAQSLENNIIEGATLGG